MTQDDQPEKESGIRNQELGGKTAEEKPSFEVSKQETGGGERATGKTEKPAIPETQKPQIPQGEDIPTSGPGDQGQTQQTTQTQTNADLTQTDADKTEKIKKELKRPIHINTPRERKESSKIEDEHNRDILSQP